jgi:signal transduction histidine kinase
MRFNIQFKMLAGYILVVVLVSVGSWWSIDILEQTWADQVALADAREAVESLKVFTDVSGLLQKLDVLRKKSLVSDRVAAGSTGEPAPVSVGDGTSATAESPKSYAALFDQEADQIEKQLRELRPVLARVDDSQGMREVRTRLGTRGLSPVLRSIEADFAEYRRHFRQELKTPPEVAGVPPIEEGWHPLVVSISQRMARDLVVQVAAARDSLDAAAKQHKSEGQQLVSVLPLVPGLFALLISFLITRRIANPIRDLRRATERIAGGDFTRPIRVQSRDEVGDLARAMNRMSQRLAELDEMKSGFLFNVSHELKTPLTSIKEAAALLQEEVPGAVNQKQRRLLEIISAETRILIGMIVDLLDLARMEAGRMGYRFERTSPAAIVRRAVEQLKFTAQCRGVSMNVNESPALGNLILDGDKLVNAVKNLVGNAVKFSPRGGEVAISIKLAPPSVAPPVEGEAVWSTVEVDRLARVQAPSVLISVEDRGPGIPEQDLPLIFEKFYQSERRSDSKVKGTGLGLAIVRHVVEAHGGSVAVRSALGRGSTFTISLPLSAGTGEREPTRLRPAVAPLEVKHDAV